ncbi:hypothetical protein F4818DRAFT_444363 [Hypoxylon cercidicola]|nr:hypothetical protein F4818DRAFT_444363 [Hypoxylon cercidicola]
MIANDLIPSDKRRSQNRESQRRFREKRRKVQDAPLTEEPERSPIIRKQSGFTTYSTAASASPRPVQPAIVVNTNTATAGAPATLPLPSSAHHNIEYADEWTTVSPSQQCEFQLPWSPNCQFEVYDASNLEALPVSSKEERKYRRRRELTSVDPVLVHNTDDILTRSQNDEPKNCNKSMPALAYKNMPPPPTTHHIGPATVIDLSLSEHKKATITSSEEKTTNKKRSVAHPAHTTPAGGSGSGSGSSSSIGAEIGISRAERMITEVENLYAFGVTVGILPEDREVANVLRKMKMRFRSIKQNQGYNTLRPSRGSQSELTESDEDSDESPSSVPHWEDLDWA